MNISESANIRGLAARVITLAIEELLFGHPIYRQSAYRKKFIHANTKAQLQAFTFLTSKDFEFWAEAANVDLSNLDIVLADPETAKRMLQQKPRNRRTKNNE